MEQTKDERILTMILYYSCWMCPDQSYSLSKAGITSRLTSFYFKDMTNKENTIKYMKGETLPFQPQQPADNKK